MHKVLITGANGALGKAVAASFADMSNIEILKAMRSTNDDSELRLDVLDKQQVVSVIQIHQPRIIVHLAATFDADFEQSYKTNVLAAKYILDAVRDQQAKTRVLLIGSAAEYGVINPEENPIKEDHVLTPVSVYGVTKAWQTQLATLYASYGVDVLVARVFNLEGNGLSDRLFIGRVHRQIEEFLSAKRTVIETGSLSATRDYVNLKEAASQILSIAKHGSQGKIYHVASGVPVVMRDLLKKMLSENNIKMNVVQESNALSNRKGYDVPVIYADVKCTLELMGLKGRGIFDA